MEKTGSSSPSPVPQKDASLLHDCDFFPDEISTAVTDPAVAAEHFL